MNKKIMKTKDTCLKFVCYVLLKKGNKNILNNNKNGIIMDSSLVANVRRLLHMDCEMVVHHSYRKTNQCADIFADFECSLHINICFYEFCPTQFNQDI